MGTLEPMVSAGRRANRPHNGNAWRGADHEAMVSAVSVASGYSGMTADNLARLAERVRRLSRSHRDPERFHQDKSE
jgi:hypothetical protein